MKKLLSKYNFVDISIYMRVQTGEYVNITDYIVSDDNEHISLKSDAKFVLTFCSFIKQERYACSITLTELLKLAGIHDTAFLRRFKDSLKDGDNDELLAVLCAKKIVDYNYGKILRKDGNENTYSFHRQGYTKVEGKNKRIYPLIFEKTLYIV